MEEPTTFPHRLDDSTPPISARVSRSTQPELTGLAAQLLFDLQASGVAIANEIPSDPACMICVVTCGEIAPPLGALLDVNSGISGRAVRVALGAVGSTLTVKRHVQLRKARLFSPWLAPEEDSVPVPSASRSLVVAPLCRNSSCIGVLEVFSDRPGAFDSAALSRIREEAARAAALTTEDQQPADLRLQDPQNWEEPLPAFKVDQHGRLSSLPTPPVERHLTGHTPNEEHARFLNVPAALKRQWRWIALAAVAASLAFSTPRLLHHTNARVGSRTPSAVVENSASTSVQIPSTTSDLVSDASPPVRVLMAQALAGNARAQSSLADHYAAGEGVARDRVKAMVWYIIAGTKGKQRANRSAVQITRDLQPFEVGQVRFNVGKMFRDGVGTSQNLVTAYSWFSLAETAGDPRANAEQRKLEEQMPADQVAEARRRATEWLHRFRPRSAKETLATNSTRR